MAFGTWLNNLEKNWQKDHGKKFYLSAAPGCPLPIPTLGVDATVNWMPLDMLFVQCYNNWACDLTDKNQPHDWDGFARKKGVRFFAGLPASVTAAKTGYVPLENLPEIVERPKGYGTSAGVMLWDASQSWWNDMYHKKVSEALEYKFGSLDG